MHIWCRPPGILGAAECAGTGLQRPDSWWRPCIEKALLKCHFSISLRAYELRHPADRGLREGRCKSLLSLWHSADQWLIILQSRIYNLFFEEAVLEGLWVGMRGSRAYCVVFMICRTKSWSAICFRPDTGSLASSARICLSTHFREVGPNQANVKTYVLDRSSHRWRLSSAQGSIHVWCKLWPP